MNKFTVVRNPMYATIVQKLLVPPVTSKHLKEFTLEHEQTQFHQEKKGEKKPVTIRYSLLNCISYL
jgi:hypothetical protein